MTKQHWLWFFGLLAVALTAFSFGAYADIGAPVAGQMGMQAAASPVAERIHEFHHLLMIIITGVVIFVTALLLYVMVRFNAKANPEPSTTTHHVMLEVIWTVVPIIILIVIAVPSFKLLFYQDKTDKPEMTLKVTGKQWYWGVEYPSNGDISFDTYMIADKDIDTSKNQIRLLSTDNPIVLPIETNIQILTTATDVIHSFTVPSLGFKMDSVPGRLNETWVRIDRTGTYYGQCSELCGKGHAFMPVEIKAVTKDEFAAWVAEKGGNMPSLEGATNEAAVPAPAVEGAAAAVPVPAAAETPVEAAAPATETAIQPESTTPESMIKEKAE
jgi:cytochrome c oxidase subunit 2